MLRTSFENVKREEMECEQESTDNGRRTREALLSQEPAEPAQAVTVAGGYGGHLSHNQPGPQGTCPRAAPGTTRAEHPVWAGRKEYGTLY